MVLFNSDRHAVGTSYPFKDKDLSSCLLSKKLPVKLGLNILNSKFDYLGCKIDSLHLGIFRKTGDPYGKAQHVRLRDETPLPLDLYDVSLCRQFLHRAAHSHSAHIVFLLQL